MEEIILYSNGCPKCMVLKSKLQAKNINFKESDNFEKLESLGFRSLPILKMGTDYKNFTQANAWVNEQECK